MERRNAASGSSGMASWSRHRWNWAAFALGRERHDFRAATLAVGLQPLEEFLRVMENRGGRPSMSGPYGWTTPSCQPAPTSSGA